MSPWKDSFELPSCMRNFQPSNLFHFPDAYLSSKWPDTSGQLNWKRQICTQTQTQTQNACCKSGKSRHTFYFVSSATSARPRSSSLLPLPYPTLPSQFFFCWTLTRIITSTAEHPKNGIAGSRRFVWSPRNRKLKSSLPVKRITSTTFVKPCDRTWWRRSSRILLCDESQRMPEKQQQAHDNYWCGSINQKCAAYSRTRFFNWLIDWLTDLRIA